MSTLKNLMAAGIRVLLVGGPGCAKTARIEAIANELGRRLVTVRAALSERVDFGGALVPDVKGGVTKALPLELLKDLQTTTEPTLLFLDDLGQAPMDVQSALMRLFDKGELSPHVLIWGATNRPGDVCGVSRLGEQLKSRYGPKFEIPTPGTVEASDGAQLLGTWEDEVAAWCDWAMDRGAAAEIVAWHRSTNGRTLYAWQPNPNPGVSMPDFRAWETVINLWENGIQDLATISAVIGKSAAAEFLQFARLAHELPTPDQVWDDPAGAPVPQDPSALFLIATMLAANVSEQTVDATVTYMARMPRVYGALLARDMYKKDELGPAMRRSKQWVKWFTTNQELFAVG